MQNKLLQATEKAGRSVLPSVLIAIGLALRGICKGSPKKSARQFICLGQVQFNLYAYLYSAGANETSHPQFEYVNRLMEHRIYVQGQAPCTVCWDFCFLRRIDFQFPGVGHVSWMVTTVMTLVSDGVVERHTGLMFF